MQKLIYIIFAILAGCSTALEAHILGEFGKNTNILISTFFSLVFGAMFFLIGMLVFGNVKDLIIIKDISPLFVLGGIFGALVIYFTTAAVLGLGLSNTLVLIFVSQIIISFFIDSVLLANTTTHLYKYVGLGLVTIGVFFIIN